MGEPTQRSPFPYVKTYSLRTPHELFKKLRLLTVEEHVTDEKSTALITMDSIEKPTKIDISHDIYHEIDMITDLFTEEARMKARVGNNMTPLELWAKDEHRVRDYSRKTYRNESECHLRESIYHIGREATLYKASITKVLCDLFCPKGGVYLDPFAGWGDRIIGDLASDNVSKYIGIDPNPNLPDGYKNIIDTFDYLNKATFVSCPFEDYKIAPESVDFILSSPPYYDFEVYTNINDPLQSVYNYSGYNEWRDKWLKAVIQKMERCLKKGGVMILYVGGTYRCPKLPEDILKLVSIPLFTTVDRTNGMRAGKTFIFKKVVK